MEEKIMKCPKCGNESNNGHACTSLPKIDVPNAPKMKLPEEKLTSYIEGNKIIVEWALRRLRTELDLHDKLVIEKLKELGYVKKEKLKEFKDELSLAEIDVDFDGAEGGRFFIHANEDLYEVSLEDAERLKKFLEYWLSK